jgi:hypothetical protein
MSTIDFIRGGLRRLHNDLDTAVGDLTPDQAQWTATERGLPVSFILWHYVRTEDNIIQFVLQRKPTVWMEGGWDKKFGLHPTGQGTGMSHEDARNLRLEPLDDFLAYMQDVWKSTDEYLGALSDEDLERPITVKPLGEMPVQNAIGMMCLTHGFTHLGEIAHVRGLLGLRGMAV